jgi:hypothetical protein
MSNRISADLRRLVQERAKQRCEYCLLHSDNAFLFHEPDHIIARKHDGATDEENLAWSCFICNRFKGTDISSIDPESGEITRLFHPRKDVWDEHFRLEGGAIVGLTARGRATSSLLQFNRRESVEIRNLLQKTGQYPRSTR